MNSLFRIKFSVYPIIYNIFNYKSNFIKSLRNCGNYKLFTEVSNAITFPQREKMEAKIMENTGGERIRSYRFSRFMQKRGRENWKHLKLLAVRGQAGP